MSNVYRKKNCPYCNVEHRKRGEYCSASHAALDRSEEAKKKVSDWMKYSDRGQELTGNLKNQEIDELPSVGGITNRSSNSFVSDGDLWTSDNGDW